MKFLTLLALAFSLNSFADTTIERTFDGKNAVCQIKGDVGRRAYTATIESEKLVDNNRELSLRIHLYKCAETDKGLALVKTTPSEVTHSYVLLPNGELGQTNNTVIWAKFFLTDKNEKLLGKSDINLSYDDVVLTYTIDKNIESAFVRATFKNSVELPTGEVLNDIFEYYGGFVVKFAK